MAYLHSLLAIKGEGVSSMVATTLDAAAGLAQRQKWGLILPSNARVSLLTYQTVLGVHILACKGLLMDGSTVDMSPLKPRCREDSWGSGMFQRVSTLSALEWLQANIEFGHDSANNLAVLHNQRILTLGLPPKGKFSRSVTSCGPW